MASVVTLLSSDDEDNDEIQFVCEKPAGFSTINTKSVVKKELVSNEVNNQGNDSLDAPSDQSHSRSCDIIKKIVPTLISTSVTIKKVEHEESPKGGSGRSSSCKTSEETEVIFLDSDNEDSPSPRPSGDVDGKSTNGSRCAPGTSENNNDAKSVEDSDGSSSVQDISSDDDSVMEIESDDGESEDEPQGKTGEVEDAEEDDSEEEKKREDQPNGTDASVRHSPDSVAETVAQKDAADHPAGSKASNDVDETLLEGPGNVTEKLLNLLLLKISQVGYTEDNVNCVKRKIMKYYDSSPVEFTQSSEFVDSIKSVIGEISRIMERPDGKELATLSAISDKIKEFLAVFQRNSPHVTAKLARLYKMYERLAKRLKKIEVQEVESDDEYENAYIMQSRYETRITAVYAKICELENKGSHANRNYKQEFVYTGFKDLSIVPISVQRALEKYYNKTKLFPDFQDVWKLVKKVNDSDKLGMTKTQTYTAASLLFSDFGTKLKRRRQYDDYLVMKSYEKEDAQAASDPAMFDVTLQEKLQMNKLNQKTEEEVLNEFVAKEAQNPTPDVEDTDGEEKDSEVENEEESVGVPDGNMFIDSDEEMTALENVEETRRRIEDDCPPTKKIKTGDTEGFALHNSENGSSVINESPPKNALEACGLRPN